MGQSQRDPEPMCIAGDDRDLLGAAERGFRGSAVPIFFTILIETTAASTSRGSHRPVHSPQAAGSRDAALHLLRSPPVNRCRRCLAT